VLYPPRTLAPVKGMGGRAFVRWGAVAATTDAAAAPWRIAITGGRAPDRLRAARRRAPRGADPFVVRFRPSSPQRAARVIAAVAALPREQRDRSHYEICR
jgi:hypothetical protein